jgi:hypothetical protein
MVVPDRALGPPCRARRSRDTARGRPDICLSQENEPLFREGTNKEPIAGG